MNLGLIPVDCVWGKVGRVVVMLMNEKSTFVAGISEGVVKVLASHTGPVSWSDMGWLVFVLSLVWLFLWPLLLILVLDGFSWFLGISLLWGQFHVSWLASDISVISLLFASEALFSSLEIIIWALAAFPASIWEVEIGLVLLELNFLLGLWCVFS